MSCEPESVEERIAHRLLEAILDQPFEKVCPSSKPGKVVDLRSRPTAPPRVAEVKRLVSQELLALENAFQGSSRAFDSDSLNQRWFIAIEARTLRDVLVPLPVFDEPNEADVAFWEAAGFNIPSAEEQRSAFLAKHPRTWRPVPPLQTLARDLEPDLKILEDDGISNTRGAEPSSGEANTALMRIARRTQNAICMSHPPGHDERPGIELTLARGGVRTERGAAIVGRIDAWLQSDLSANLLESLRAEPDSERHAVLVIDPASEPEAWTSGTDRAHLKPTDVLDLPDGIDVLWFILEEDSFRFAPGEGWTAHKTPP